MNDACASCPCPTTCLRWPVFCAWAATGDPVLRRHIAARSGSPPELVVVAVERPETAETVAQVREINRCPYRSTVGCGCGGARCALRGGALVSHLDCLPCVRRYGGA